jgi:hypothetical protein
MNSRELPSVLRERLVVGDNRLRYTYPHSEENHIWDMKLSHNAILLRDASSYQLDENDQQKVQNLAAICFSIGIHRWHPDVPLFQGYL